MNILMFLDNISKSFLLLFIILFVLGFYNKFYWLVLVAVLLFDVFIGIVKYSIGNKVSIFQRPHGASACNILCSPSNDEGKPGFPSGHVASTTMILLILSYYIKDIRFTISALIYITLMALSRHSKRCHNWTQIIYGFIFGAVGALVFIQLTPREILT
jgi:membrane-associated phospholipid phosphatase